MMQGRTIAVGDIHGCATALRAVLGVVTPTTDDTVVILGDVIDRGPDSKGVVERLLELDNDCTMVTLMGNHEEMFAAALEGADGLRYWLRFGGDRVLASYAVSDPHDLPWAHRSFLRGGKDYFETETHLFVHANYRPDFPLAMQSATLLRWAFLEPAKSLPHYSGKVAVVGHTPQMHGEVLDLGHLVCIDTGCYNGGWLTALDVGSGCLWQANEQGEVRLGALGRGGKR
jgi:serine/threonine protein phosphatase 1